MDGSNGHPPAETQRLLGTVTAADTEKGVTVHLQRGQSVELLRQGQFVVIDGRHMRFFGTISGFRLGATDPALSQDPPEGAGDLVRETLSRSTTYAEATVRPALELTQGAGAAATEGLKPARTIPGHFASVYTAGARDFQTVFGSEERGKHFPIGRPRDMDVPVCLDLERFVERSNGIFGRSGTGKSFLARLLLCGLVKTQACANLVFDMHTEYAYSKEKEGGGFVKGLRELFGGARVRVYSLDETATRRTRGQVDGLIRIPVDSIQVDDLMTLQSELELTETAEFTAALLHNRFGNQWLARLLALDPGEIKEFCEQTNAQQNSLEALKRRVERLKELDFIVRDGRANLGTGIDELIAELQGGHNVILEFGRYNSLLAYMLVANIITKRIHRRWVEASEHYDDTQQAADKPRPLMVTIEEAHKFLSQRSTIFSTIAREMRKYSVTLLVIDQRPSSIDPEVLSQLGTRITALLSDERDIDAVFTGTRAAYMRQTLATLDSRQEVLIFGHAVPMEVVLRTRDFDESLYRSVAPAAVLSRAERAAQAAADLFGEE